MKANYKMFVGVLLSFCLLFAVVGFAALSDELTVSGSASTPANTTLHISNVTKQAGGGSLDNCSYSACVLTSTVDLGNRSTTTVTLDVTFTNNSAMDYMYYGTEILDSSYSNSSVSFSVSGLTEATTKKEGTIIKSGEKLTAQVTFRYDNTSDMSPLDSVINFIFKPANEYEGVEEILDALGRFKEILNTPTDRTTLINAMEAKSDPTYIGNVAGAGTNDTRVLNGLFTVTKDGETINYLHFDFDKNGTVEEDEYVTIMIKAENLDGDESTGITVTKENWWGGGTTYRGCEMSIHLVSAVLGANSTPDEVVTFVATCQTLDGGETWEQIGELFAGKAETIAYSGWSGNDSIDTRTWVSTVAYNDVAAGSKLSALIQSYKK